MDIAFSYYLTKKIELQEKKKPKCTIIRESCTNCGQQTYWCQCENNKFIIKKKDRELQSNISRMIRSYSFSSDDSE